VILFCAYTLFLTVSWSEHVLSHVDNVDMRVGVVQ